MPEAQTVSETVQRVVQLIAERFAPQQIVLFGSQATGAATPDSDADLLVIMDTEEPPLHTAARIAAAIPHPVPLDILVMRPADWRGAQARRSVFAQTVAQEGITVYEA